MFAGCAALVACEPAPEWPYDAETDAVADVRRAIAQADRTGRLLLLVFGANWCEDCRQLDRVMQRDPLAELVEDAFSVVKVDVGNWDHNLDVVTEWGDPIAGGIPAVVVATSGRQVLYSTKAGELATARHMGDDELYLRFAHMAELGEIDTD